jgi:hypothetical protein
MSDDEKKDSSIKLSADCVPGCHLVENGVFHADECPEGKRIQESMNTEIRQMFAPPKGYDA